MKRLLFFLALAILVPSLAHAVIGPAQLISLANQDRATSHIVPLQENPILDKAAQKRADYLVSTGYFSHQDKEGQMPWHYFTETGYKFTNAGENLARGFKDPESTETAFMNSPSHKANILNARYKDIGIGISQDSQGNMYVVEFYGSRQDPLRN